MEQDDGRALLTSRLAPVVGSSSVDTVVEYLCSFEDLQAVESRDDMVLFLESSFGHDDNFAKIVEDYISLRAQSTVPSPSEKGNDKGKVEKNIKPHSKKMNASAPPFKPTFSTHKGGSEKPSKIQQSKKGQSAKQTKNPKDSITQVCGCMANYHSLFASCVACGRVHCSKEESAQAVCVYCGAVLLVEVTSEAALSNPLWQDIDKEACEKAYAQKDKLLTFDNECAKRTHVFDAQGDYYETGTWLTEDEKHEMDEKEKSRRDKGMRRPQLKMALSIDVAERKTIFNDCENMEDKAVSQPDTASNFSQLKIDYELGNSVTEMNFDLPCGLENTALLATSSRGNKAAALYESLRNRISQDYSHKRNESISGGSNTCDEKDAHASTHPKIEDNIQAVSPRGDKHKDTPSSSGSVSGKNNRQNNKGKNKKHRKTHQNKPPS